MNTESTDSMDTADVTWDYVEGQLVRLFCGRPEQAWELYEAPEWALRAALRWNDPEAQGFPDCDRSVFEMCDLIAATWER